MAFTMVQRGGLSPGLLAQTPWRVQLPLHARLGKQLTRMKVDNSFDSKAMGHSVRLRRRV